MPHSRAHEVCTTKNDVLTRFFDLLIDTLSHDASVIPQLVRSHDEINMFDVTHVLIRTGHTQTRKQ